MSGKQFKLNALVVARYAEDFGLSGADAWRMFREGTPEFRTIMARHYATALRAEAMDRYMTNPEDIAIDDLSYEISINRRNGTGIFDKHEPRRGHPGHDVLVAVEMEKQKSGSPHGDNYPGTVYANTCYADSSPMRRGVLLASPPSRWDDTDPRNAPADDECGCGCAEPK